MSGGWRWSLRSRLLAVMLSAITLTTAVATGATWYWARHEIDALLDYHLRQQALALRDKATMLGTVVVPEPDPEQDFVIQAWDWRGRLVYLSHRGITLPRPTAPGYAEVEAGAADWRTYAMPLGTHLVQIAQPMALRRALATRAALKILYPVLAVLPVLGLLLWWGVGRALAPLQRLAHLIGRRDAAMLSPLPEIGLPEELRAMVRALNDLMARLSEVLARERAFMADAAHELRTPLTALQLQAQLFERAKTAQDQAEAVTALRAGVQRSARLIERLLAYARAASDEAGARERVDLGALARACVTEFAPRAEALGLALDAAIAEHGEVLGSEAGLRSVIANLLDNALRHVPAPGRVALDVGGDLSRVWVRVTDTGPGIPPGERARIFERFRRLAGASVPGTGLGLAIVKRIVERHHGSIELTAGPGGVGACFTVNLPRAAAPDVPA